MISLKCSLTKEIQAGLAIVIISLVSLFPESFPCRANIRERNCLLFMVPSLVGILIAAHFSIEHALGCLTKSFSLPRVDVLKRRGIILGWFASNAVIILGAAGYLTLYTVRVSATLHIQVILNLMELRSILEFLLDEKCSFTLAQFTFSVLVSLISVSTIGYAMALKNELLMQIAILGLSLASVACMVGASYTWWKWFCSNTNFVSVPRGGLNLRKYERKYLTAIIGTFGVFYSIGAIIYCLSLVYAGHLIAQRMTLMMYYLNNVCVYILLLQDSVIRRLHCVQLQVSFTSPLHYFFIS